MFIFLYGRLVHHCVSICCFLYPFSVDGHTGLFKDLANEDFTAIIVDMHVTVYYYDFYFFRKIYRRGIAGSKGISIFCIISTQMTTGVVLVCIPNNEGFLFLQPYQHLLLLDSLKSAILSSVR